MSRAAAHAHADLQPSLAILLLRLQKCLPLSAPGERVLLISCLFDSNPLQQKVNDAGWPKPCQLSFNSKDKILTLNEHI
jgi:hypothetical protein